MRRSGGAVLAVMGLVTTVLLPMAALQHEVAAVGQRIEHQVEKKLFSKICTASLDRAGRAEWARWCDPGKTIRDRLGSWSRDRLTRAKDRIRARGRVARGWEAEAQRDTGGRAMEGSDPSRLRRDTEDVVRREGGGSPNDTAGESPGTAPAEAEVDLRVASGEALEGEAIADTVAAGTEALDVAGATRFAVGRGNVIGTAVLVAFSAVTSAWEAHRRQEAGPLVWSADDVPWALGACRLPDLLWALGTPKSLLAWTFWYGWGEQLRAGGRASVDGSYRDILEWGDFTPRGCVYAADPAAMQGRVAEAFTSLERRAAVVDRSAVGAATALTLDDLTSFLIGLAPRGGDLGGLEDVVLALEQPESTSRAQLLDSLRQGRWDPYDRLYEAAISPLAAGAGGPGEKIQASLDAVVRECGCRSGVADPPASGALIPVDEETSTAMLLAMADVLSNDDVATDPQDGSEVQTSVGREGNTGLFQVLPSQFESAMTEGGETRQGGQQVDTSVASQAVAAAQLLADALQRRGGNLEAAFAQFVHDNRLPPWDAAWRGMSAPEGWDDLFRTRGGRQGHLPTATLLAAATREYAVYLSAPDVDPVGSGLLGAAGLPVPPPALTILFEAAARRHAVPLSLLLAVASVEDGSWDATATSPAGARGIMQLLPGTFERYGTGGAITDPTANIDAGAAYLGELLATGLDPSHTVFAYNSGPAAAYGSTPEGVHEVETVMARVPVYEQWVEAGEPRMATGPIIVPGEPSPLFPWVPASGYPDAFPAGQCTYWAAYNVHVTWNGNAREWVVNARGQGYAIAGSPLVGSIVVWEGGPYDPRFGHVAVVTAVTGGDLYTVSEMDYVGVGVVDTRSIHYPDPFALGFIVVPH